VKNYNQFHISKNEQFLKYLHLKGKSNQKFLLVLLKDVKLLFLNIIHLGDYECFLF
jgi:hypothetical protein